MELVLENHDQASALPGSREISPFQLLALLVIYFALWLLMTPYAGLTHDAQAYAFQALARLDPAVLGQDVFLRYQSQDRFTVFPPIYAALVEAFGLETTAATLTFSCHLLWYSAAFLLARQLFGLRLALLCLGLLIAIPGPYGGQRVFHIAEPFLSARLPAEALALLAVWAYLRDSRLIATALLCAAFLIHPLMAFPVALLLAMLWIDQARPLGLTQSRAALMIVLGAIVGSILIGGSTRSMDTDWVATTHIRSAFLFLDRWQAADWNHTILSLMTVVIASLAIPPGLARSTIRGVFWVALAGLVLAAFASEIWNLTVLMQGQPWRWLWLARFFAILFLPATLYATWSAGLAGRATALLLAAAWLAVLPVSARTLVPQLMGALLAGLACATWIMRTRLTESTQLLIQRGAWAVLALVLVAAAITASLSAMVVQIDLDISRATPRLLMVLKPITPAIIIVAAAWAILRDPRPVIVTSLMLVLGLALLVVAAPSATENWTHRAYSDENVARFDDWRAAIPPDAEVFWWDGLREVWFLLDRRSYLTLSQGGGVVFSSDISAELRRRAGNTAAFIDPGYWFNEPNALAARPNPLTREILAQICRDPALGFVVSREDIGTGAPRKEWPSQGKYVYLYDCDDFRGSGTP